MRSTGIEPITFPWKGNIIPLNYERDEKRKKPFPAYIMDKFLTKNF
jgi:hypothetical protein